MRAACSHGGQRMAVVQNLVMCDHVLRDVAHVDGVLTRYRGGFDLTLRKIRCRDNREDTRQLQRLLVFDRFDSGMSMRAAQNFAIQHPRKRIIGAIFSAPGYLLDTIMPYRPGANNPKS